MSEANPKVQVIRSIYQFGSPILVEKDGETIRYEDKTDREAEQLEHFNDIILYPFVENLDATYGDDPDDTGFDVVEYAYALE